MPRFYFHLFSADGCQRDEIGFDFADAEAAYIEAYRTIPRIAADLLEKGSDPMGAAFEITDEKGSILFQIPFTERVRAQRTAMARTPPNFRSARANLFLAENVFHRAFESALEPHLILSPDLRIAGANAAYCKASLKRQDELKGILVFDAFPDNPDDPTATGVKNISASFQRVLATGRRDVVPLQRYDTQQPDGTWLMRHWHPTNWAFFDEQGSVIALVHHVIEATPMMR
jgi:PAS domain-containing protein